MSETFRIDRKVLAENDRLAGLLRARFREKRILALNLVSSPGSGKTSLLERTLGALGDTLRMGLIAGDVQTENDANRLIRAGGKTVRPIVTGGACHLDALMVTRALEELTLDELDVLFIENVGNLVCPAGYDLGEDMKVVLISTTEGDDKPLKYPAMFRRSDVLIINKLDLLGLSDFDVRKARANALAINGRLVILETSCRTGDGLDVWYAWVKNQVARKKSGDSG